MTGSTHTIDFYTDGACSGNHRPDEQGSMGAGRAIWRSTQTEH